MKKYFGFCLVLVFASSVSNLSASETTSIEMQVKTITLDSTSQTPVVILESSQEKKLLPIWIGNNEAASIAMELEHVATPRPLTHDLIRNILQGLGATLYRITITDLRNSTYYATITLKLKGQEFQIDSRPSDAIAVALKMKAPIFASSVVLAKARPAPGPSKENEGMRKSLGMQVQDLTPELAGLFDLQVAQGILVADVELGSAASTAGLTRGDIILKVNDKAVQKVSSLESALKGLKKPAQLKLEILRKGKPTSIVIDLPS
jgi:bifunctional DNase/RNase